MGLAQPEGLAALLALYAGGIGYTNSESVDGASALIRGLAHGFQGAGVILVVTVLLRFLSIVAPLEAPSGYHLACFASGRLLEVLVLIGDPAVIAIGAFGERRRARP